MIAISILLTLAADIVFYGLVPFSFRRRFLLRHLPLSGFVIAIIYLKRLGDAPEPTQQDIIQNTPSRITQIPHPYSKWVEEGQEKPQINL